MRADISRRRMLIGAAATIATAAFAHDTIVAAALRPRRPVLVATCPAVTATLSDVPLPPPPPRPDETLVYRSPPSEHRLHVEDVRSGTRHFYVLDARNWMIAGDDGEARYPLVELMRDPSKPIALLGTETMEPLGWFATREAALDHLR